MLHALNFINRRFGSLFWLLGVPIGSLFHKKWVPIGSLSQSLGVPNSFWNSGIGRRAVDGEQVEHRQGLRYGPCWPDSEREHFGVNLKR